MIPLVTTDGLHHKHHFFPLQIHTILLVHNIFAVNRNKLAMNFSSSFSSCGKKSNARTSHLVGFLIDTAILNTHCEHNVAVTVADELCPVIRFLSHTAAPPFLKKKLEFLLDLYLSFPNILRK
jgi:hypothetical protein